MSSRILFLFILLVCISLSVSQRRRRRRSCSRVDCQVTSWSSWSACSAIKCGQPGTRDRSRTVQIPPLCSGTPCPSLQEASPCQGTLRVDCQLSPWSTWSACSFACGGSQTSTRYVVANEQCGGTPCNLTISKTESCNLTQCLNQGTLVDGQCSCLTGYYGSCCQFNGRLCTTTLFSLIFVCLSNGNFLVVSRCLSKLLQLFTFVFDVHFFFACCYCFASDFL